MSYKATAYHADSDADDEYERSVITSPTLAPPDFEASPTDSDPPSTEHTPTTYTHSRDGHPSPTGLIIQWTAELCADLLATLGLPQYQDTFIENAITGEALISLQQSDLKEMGIASIGHRMTILKSVYDIKVKQHVPLEEDDFVPQSAAVDNQDSAPTQDDVARIIRIIRDRDERITTAETELRILRDDIHRLLEENRKLREDFLPLARLAKEKSQPLPTPDDQANGVASEKSSSLSRKFSTKKLFLSSAPKNPSPTIHEGRTLSDTSTLDPSAAALAASTHLTASMRDAAASGLPSPHHPSQPSPTSPAPYNTQLQGSGSSSRGFPRSTPHQPDDLVPSFHSTNSTWSNASTILPDRGPTPSAGANASTPLLGTSSAGASTPSSTTGTLTGTASQTSAASTPSSNPQVEIFKSFRVSIDDPCHKVLPVALKKYNITADWRQYALYIVHGDQERCLGLNERPLILFKQLDKEGRKPMFMLRRHAAPQEGHVNFINQGTQHGGLGELPGGVL
ncbi:RA-domain-containing protein [Eremomyces bilateralis CBS 781.70]|uniref:RA-domain-containing protein n=1 Tax=Eremomyces bilateralis CBS 781.70 TaxID=1392243 RepID=A0A6G1GBH7_9PEZI|nr:RA-domain-containing protein [Eremomyces bilateralis CBS 781.70]KAF1815364.1 RA-domain-containing protein [Eremomyces bilateralis CBS 781.70]